MLSVPRISRVASALAATAAFVLLSVETASALSLNPEAGSPGVEKANTLHTIIFVIAIIAIVGINLTIAKAAKPSSLYVSGSAGRSRWTTGRVAGMLSVFAVALFVVGTIYSSSSRSVPESRATVADADAEEILNVKVTGQQWMWRYSYPNGAFGYHRLVVPAGVTVGLDLVSSDVVHGWNVPSLTGKAQAVPGKTNRIYFRADEPGVHSGRASVLSGQGYADMESLVEVVSPDEFETYVKQLKTDIQGAQDDVERTLADQLREATGE